MHTGEFTQFSTLCIQSVSRNLLKCCANMFLSLLIESKVILFIQRILGSSRIFNLLCIYNFCKYDLTMCTYICFK